MSKSESFGSLFLIHQICPMAEKLRIIFLGTPEFAQASLQALVESGHHIVAVITAPDRPKGRGKQLATSAVKDYAVKEGLPVLQPTNLKKAEFLAELKTYRADIQVVVAFRMLPEAVWNMPRLGTFNLHASLLPQYRGAAPINWAIINGEQETGVTTFFLQHEIDTGKIIFQEKEPIAAWDTVGTLYARLMAKGARLVVKTMAAIQEGNYPQEDQPQLPDLRNAPKLYRQTCEINWTDDAEAIRNKIRGLSPYPAAWTTLEGKNLKLFDVQISRQESTKDIGVFDSDGKGYLRVKTGKGTIEINELQLEGKKRMETVDFLRGVQF